MKRRFLALAMSSILALAALSGCGGSKPAATTAAPASAAAGQAESTEAANLGNTAVAPDSAEVKVKDSIVIAMTNDMPSPAPYGSNNTVTAMLTNSTFNRLVKINSDNDIVPELATEWSGNDDSTEWTFKLRDDVDFQNGEHFTAADVVFTFEYANSTENEGITFPINGTEQIDQIETPDDYTVVFKLKNTCADWPYYAAQKIMSKATIEKEGIEAGGVIGTGPFKFVSYEPGVQWVMERNENYFGELPKTRQITFIVISDGNARTLSLESGDSDVVFDPDPSDVAKFLDNPEFNVYSHQNLSTVFMGINCERIGADPQIRRALAMAINRDDIIAVCYEDGKLGSPSFNYINAASPLHSDVTAIPYDPEGAKKILEDLGYDKNNKLEFRLCTANKFLSLAEIIQANLSAVNVNVTVSEFSQSGYSNSLREDGKYDAYMQQSSSQGAIMNIATRFFRSDGKSNVMNYKSPELDAMMDEAVQSKNLEEMAEKYAKVQQFLADEVPAIPLVDQYLWCVGTKNFYGVDLNNQYYYVDFTNCYVVEE